MNLQNKQPKNIIGAAGEYFVAAELSRQGIIATLTLKNTPNVDVIATTLDGHKTVNIQVKTKQNSQGWRLSDKTEIKTRAKNFFVVFVDLYKPDKVEYYVIPKNVLAKEISKGHKKWLDTPGKDGRHHVDWTGRIFKPLNFPQSQKYKNNWMILGLWK